MQSGGKVLQTWMYGKSTEEVKHKGEEFSVEDYGLDKAVWECARIREATG